MRSRDAALAPKPCPRPPPAAGRFIIIIIIIIIIIKLKAGTRHVQPPFARARYFYIALVVVVVVVRVAVGLVVPHVDVHEVVVALHRAQVVGADLGAPEQLDRLDPGAAWEFPMEKKGVEAVCWFCGCPVGRLLALAALAAGADGVGAVRAGLDAGTVAQHLGVGAPRACDAARMVDANGAVVAADTARALAGAALLVEPIGARERGAALAGVCERATAIFRPRWVGKCALSDTPMKPTGRERAGKQGSDRGGQNGQACRVLTVAWVVRD